MTLYFYGGMQLFIFSALLLTIIYAFGVVWRVEKKLDLAFKLFLAAIIIFAAYETVFMFTAPDRVWVGNVTLILKAIFVLLLFLGMAEMRSMLRKIDGEKK